MLFSATIGLLTSYKERIRMRLAAFTLLAAIGVSVSGVSAGAAPIASPALGSQQSAIVEIAGGCGPALHRTRRGHCVPNRYGYYRPYRYWAPYWPGYYGGDGHEPWNRPTPRDRIANRLNRQELHGIYRGY
jgi:hypothetical protein